MAKFTLVSAIALAAAIAVASPASAGFSPDAADQVKAQFLRSLASTGQAGYRMVAGDVGFMTNNGQPGFISVRLERGVSYRFLARCDFDCTDVDMALVDSSGTELIADRDDDDVPQFDYRPQRSGQYFIKLELANCAANQCHVGAVALERIAGWLQTGR